LEESNQRKILSKRLIDLLEKDRHDIAMELHDNIGQILTSLKINLEILDDKLKPMDTELGSLIKVAEKRASQAITVIKNIAHGLMPHIINALGLVSSLRTLLDEFREHTDIKIKFFNRNVPKRFDQEKELAIYRIVQEALNNIIKHAKAKNVYVSLLKKGAVLSLSVEDNGVGFDQDKAMKISKGKGPLGLVIMRERAMQLDGELTIESKMGKGTHLLAEIPI
ncbi:MAG: sensor histidine kinase, partial [Desulfobacterales bacterium]